MDSLVDSIAKHCIPCQIVTPVKTRKSLVMISLPNGSWEEVRFWEVSGRYAIVVIDDYSRFPEVEVV